MRKRGLQWVRRHRVLVVSLLLAEAASALFAGLSAPGSAQSPPPLPANDLNQLAALTGYPTPTLAPVQENPEPPVQPSPRANCGPGSRPLAGVQGRVPASAIASAAAAQGWTCNVEVVGHYGGTPGGFRVWRYVDPQGHECAFYDTSLAYPLNVFRLAAGPSSGVAVLDMSDPANPVRTATLRSLPMLAPHESLNLNARRGLLAAEMGNGTTLPGLMSIYDVSHDCRRPVLDATFVASRFGHESGFAPDGNTFWVAGGEGIAAVDVSNPKHPRTLWDGNVFAHGLNVSDDGNRLYDADPINGNLVILDVSQVQARMPNPVVREISRLTWKVVTVPQNTAPMTIDGHHYLLEFDEFGFRFTALPPPDTVGAARIIDISDEAHPRVVSNLRLEVNQPAEKAAADGDPSQLPAPATNYAAHYCAIPREVDPEIVACSFINSGLRIFNIHDPLHPREVAYYISPPRSASGGNGQASDLAMSMPAFVPERREVWYSDATTGFYALRLDPSVWPDATTGAGAPSQACPAATGGLTGAALGPVALGQSRGEIRARFGHFAARRGADVLCVAGGDLRVVYPTARLLRSLSSAKRRRLVGRAVLILTTNGHYAQHGLHPGSTLGGRPKGSTRYTIGPNTWYVTPGRTASGVIEVRGGKVQQIGVASRSLSDRAHARRLLANSG